MTKLQHCALAWKTSLEKKGELIDMRLLTPREFHQPQYDRYRCAFYSPPDRMVEDGCWDYESTRMIDKYGLEAFIFDKISSQSLSVAPNVLQRLQVDLRRFRVNGWDLETKHYYGDEHKQMLESATYV